MKTMTAIERGAEYLYVKLGAIVIAIAQVAVVKGLPMWEVERKCGNGPARRFIVSARALKPIASSLALI